LTALAAQSLSTGTEGLEALEGAVRTAMLTVGGHLLDGLVNNDTGYQGSAIDCGSGHAARFVSYRSKRLDTVLGPVTLRRAYYHCAERHRALLPRDEELGVAGSSLSPGLARMIDRTGADTSFAKATGLLDELAGVTVGVKRVERVVEADGQAAAETNRTTAKAMLERRLSPLSPDPAVDMLYLALDGTGVSMVPAATAGREGKGADGQAHTREAKLGCVFTQTRLDAEGHPVRDAGSSSYVATLEPAAEFGRLIAAEARRRGSEEIRQLVVLGDGAAWIWNLAWERFPEATQVVDLYHAREHVYDLARLLADGLEDTRSGWLAARLDDLDRGDVAALIAAARDVPLPSGVSAEDRERKLTYFDENACRMRYATFRELGMFVGSGTVETGCKTLVGQRLKCSGSAGTPQGPPESSPYEPSKPATTQATPRPTTPATPAPHDQHRLPTLLTHTP
jgi:hypothetical protein